MTLYTVFVLFVVQKSKMAITIDSFNIRRLGKINK
jgi:hypothetical protein